MGMRLAPLKGESSGGIYVVHKISSSGTRLKEFGSLPSVCEGICCCGEENLFSGLSCRDVSDDTIGVGGCCTIKAFS